jgi:hypothetical protein
MSFASPVPKLIRGHEALCVATEACELEFHFRGTNGVHPGHNVRRPCANLQS